MTSRNHWTIFNSGGAVVADNMPLEVVRAYLTPERFARGWSAVFCLVVGSEDQLAVLGGGITERQMQDQEQPDEDGDVYWHQMFLGKCVEMQALAGTIEDAQTNAYAEGRKDEREQWEPVARLALAALNTCDGDKDGYKGPRQWFNEDEVNAAINKICAVICPSCLGHGYTATVHGGSGWGTGGPDASTEYEPCDCGLSGKAAK
ncbi:MAG: hypothetical protein JWR07_1881 [Nevskia sp.]|nr:hypothetical protein [Nevskia sp.]